MPPFDGRALAADVVKVMRDYVARETDGLRAQIVALEAKIAALPVPKNGERGPVGERGDAGPAGERGEPGPAGEKGDVGSTGTPGDRGEKGDVGERGETGHQGAAGEKGDPGPLGEAGSIGPRGERGEKGDAGTNGEAGRVGEPGQKGDVGPIGEKGDAGQQGVRGDPGENVHPDSVRLMVAEEVGKAMAVVPKAENGRPGRDALELDVLPAINPEKSYSRGTFAKHAGGFWRAFRDTSGMDGWECIVDGFSEYRKEQSDDLREFTETVVMSSGKTFVRKFSQPVLIDRGLFLHDKAYEAGDVVSYDGAMWIAQKDLINVEPQGLESGWRLSVKRGRNGKDFAPVSTDPRKPVKVY